MGAALTKAFQFAVQTVLVCRQIQKTEKEYDLTRQLIKSCTSIGANLEEAEGASSKPDFRHKISLAYKEARESRYWLRLMQATDLLTEDQYNQLHPLSDEICLLLGSSLKTLDSK